MGTLYVSQAASGFNANPPSDDGSQTASNQITWNSTIKAKLADPIKALADAINSQLTTALDLSPRAISSPDSAVASDHWRTLQVTGTTTITLSDAATMTNKYVVGIANLGVGTVTVTRATGANTVNGTAADFTLAPKQAVMLGVNQGATGYNILAHSLASGAGINTIQATTGVVTPQVGAATATNLDIQANATSLWRFRGVGGNDFFPLNDNTQNIGLPSERIGSVFTSIIDSGTTGSLSLKTNNGSEQVRVINSASTANVVGLQGATTGVAPFIGAVGEANTGLTIFSQGTGGFSFRSAGGTNTLFQVIDTASSTRNITITGANGGNPTISTTAGSLAITPAVVLASTLTGPSNMLSPITNSLGSDVNLNNTANYFDGPSIAQGTSGTWFVSGTITVTDPTSPAVIYAKLWDGTTVIASGAGEGVSVGGSTPLCEISLSGFITSPSGNLRISAKDVTNTTGKMVFNTSGNSKDCTITAIRIA